METGTSVATSVVVEAPADRAFKVFTENMADWWPPEHHIIEAELADVVFEAKTGGRVYDKGVDGSECCWANVLAYEPPHRLVISWNISPAWQLEDDPARRSEIEVRFVPEGDDRTRVELEHRNLDRHGEGWEGVRDGVGAPEGWTSTLRAFAEAMSR